MRLTKTCAVVFGAALVLGGCSFSDDVLWPSLSGEDPKGSSASAEGETVVVEQYGATTVQFAQAPPPLGTTVYQPVAVAAGAPTGTYVGQKVEELRGQLLQLQSVIGSNSDTLQGQRDRTAGNAEGYHALVANINSRLQIGTTPSNPILVNQWNQAQGQLDQINGDVGILNQLSNDIATNSSTAAYILESVRATYGLGGAVDEDHLQLAVLEDEVNKTVVSIDRLLNELSEDIRRQSSYVGRERSNLTTLSVAVKNGEMFGSSLQNRAFAAAPLTGGGAPAQLSSAASGRPLVVIRFDNPNVQYEEALYTAMSRALERRPSATFELVAVAPTKGSSGEIALASANSKRQAEQVLRSLTNMGLPTDRISLSATTSSSARSNEVHIYVR
ncbi:MAG: hypothetical protein HOH66_17180 [Rhodospirillaceae bacterium]|jgi:hypothetical protein|nr:hypothetical protein [Rhodospirillaceae bacterium]